MEAYINFAMAYDDFMDNIPYHQWGKFIRKILLKENIKEGLVVDLGCGTGTFTEILAGYGYEMIGIDISAEMLEVAKNKEEFNPYDILYLLQDMREFELYGSVKAVVSVCDSVNYILKNSELKKVFERVNDYLDPGGVFLFDFNTEYKYREVIGNRTIGENREDKSFIWENDYYEEERINEIELSLFVKEKDGYNNTENREELYRKYVEIHQQKAYSLEEIHEILEEVGLEFVKSYDDYTTSEVHDKSERIVVVAKKPMNDYIVRAIAGHASIRAFGAITTNLVEEARAHHDTSPVATAALGRLLTAGVIMGSMMKNPTDVLTLQVKGTGDIGGITVTADSLGNVKGYVHNPLVMLPPKNGKLDVGGGVGEGLLSVIKDMGLKEPYSGQTVLQTGEIAEDLTYYFASSEQVPSSVGLGVLMTKDNHVKVAGGFIVQVMPFIEEKHLTQLEENIKNLDSVTSMLNQGLTAQEMLGLVLAGMDLEVTDTLPARFYCDCSKEKIEKAIISAGRDEIQAMIDDGETVEVICHFCNTAYYYTKEELKEILGRS